MTPDFFLVLVTMCLTKYVYKVRALELDRGRDARRERLVVVVGSGNGGMGRKVGNVT